MELAAAIASVASDDTEVIVVFNGTEPTLEDSPGIRIVHSAVNLGIPGGRHFGLQATSTELVGFLDDDAFALSLHAHRAISAAFEASPTVGAVTLRIVDEAGLSARRHVPRFGGKSADVGGPVGIFLGGACAIRRAAYCEAGGYWADLFYAHEELDLSWRLHDRSWAILYLADVLVQHPRLPISRHEEGWNRTGRNRVLVARRNLPWGVHLTHAFLWLLLGVARAPEWRSRAAYAQGWRHGWSIEAARRPISWSAIWRLTKVGRPPVL